MEGGKKKIHPASSHNHRTFFFIIISEYQRLYLNGLSAKIAIPLFDFDRITSRHAPCRPHSRFSPVLISPRNPISYGFHSACRF